MDATRYRATNLRQVIDARGLRYDHVAKRAGLHPATLTYVMNGTRAVTAERAQDPAQAVDG